MYVLAAGRYDMMYYVGMNCVCVYVCLCMYVLCVLAMTACVITVCVLRN